MSGVMNRANVSTRTANKVFPQDLNGETQQGMKFSRIVLPQKQALVNPDDISFKNGRFTQTIKTPTIKTQKAIFFQKGIFVGEEMQGEGPPANVQENNTFLRGGTQVLQCKNDNSFKNSVVSKNFLQEENQAFFERWNNSSRYYLRDDVQTFLKQESCQANVSLRQEKYQHVTIKSRFKNEGAFLLPTVVSSHQSQSPAASVWTSRQEINDHDRSSSTHKAASSNSSCMASSPVNEQTVQMSTDSSSNKLENSEAPHTCSSLSQEYLKSLLEQKKMLEVTLHSLECEIEKHYHD